MESQIKNYYAGKNGWIFCLGEILIVFFPALVFVNSMSSWAGQDTIKATVVVWIAYAIMFAMVWLGMKLRGISWKDFGLTFKRVNFKEALKIFGLTLLVFVIACIAFISVPILWANFSEVELHADFTKYDFLKDNLGMLFLTLISVYIISSFAEELIFRAFLINRISEMTKTLKYSKVIAVLLSSILFGLIHYEWGPMGMAQAGSMGLVMGIFYVVLKKRLWILVLAHAYMDTLLLVQLYLASN